VSAGVAAISLFAPVAVDISATMTKALVGTANNGDGKADPGDTIN
jgi:hypothetical protein